MNSDKHQQSSHTDSSQDADGLRSELQRSSFWNHWAHWSLQILEAWTAVPPAICQTLGFNWKKAAPVIKCISLGYAAVIWFGFISIPLAIFVFGFGS